VLVVEDDQLQRELVSLIFEESDMHVIACMSGEAAAAVLEKAGNERTLMFTDVELDGEMSGVDFAKIATQHFPHIDVGAGLRRDGYSRQRAGHAGGIPRTEDTQICFNSSSIP
jgi:CheY-like chemotaxis protein